MALRQGLRSIDELDLTRSKALQGYHKRLRATRERCNLNLVTEELGMKQLRRVRRSPA